MAVTCACCSMSVDWWVRLRSHPDMPICHDCLGGLNGAQLRRVHAADLWAPPTVRRQLGRAGVAVLVHNA